MTCPPPLRPRTGEHGISLVEAIVAAMILLVIGGAISTVLASSMRTQTSTRLGERKLATAEGLFERLKTDNEWAGPGGAGCHTMSAGAKTVTCSSGWLQSRYEPDALVDQSAGAQPIRYETNIIVIGIDDELDGRGNDDTDGMRPDYYHATVRVRKDGSSEKWTTLTGNIDPPGRSTTGAMEVTVCRVARQWDERFPIAGCPTSSEVLLGYPAGPIGGGTDPHSKSDWQVALDRAGPSGGALGWQMVTYDVQPAAGVKVRLRRKDGGAVRHADWYGPGCSSPSTTQVTCTMGGGGSSRVVRGILPGHYDVDIVKPWPVGYEPWALHSIPSGDTAIVEAGRTSRVLQVVKPVDLGSYTIDLRSCDHSEVQSWGSGPCVDTIQPYGVSGWMAPAASARAHWSHSGGLFSSGVKGVGAGADVITFENLAPGLYSPRIVTGSQGSITPLTNGAGGATLGYIWLDPVSGGIGGGHRPPSGVATYTRHWCHLDRRTAFLAGVGLGPEGGNIEHTHYVYDYSTDPATLVDTYIHLHYYYPALGCYKPGGGGGGAPPGPGGGGA